MAASLRTDTIYRVLFATGENPANAQFCLCQCDGGRISAIGPMRRYSILPQTKNSPGRTRYIVFLRLPCLGPASLPQANDAAMDRILRRNRFTQLTRHSPFDTRHSSLAQPCRLQQLPIHPILLAQKIFELLTCQKREVEPGLLERLDISGILHSLTNSFRQHSNDLIR